MQNEARELLYSLDPVAFAEQFFPPDDWQAGVLRGDAHTILNCSRQVGKSTTTAALAAYTARYTPDALVLLLAPTLRQSGELFRKISHMFRVMGDPVQESRGSLTLGSGSRVLCLPAEPDNIRGFSGVTLLIMDEAAFIKDTVYEVCRPMLAVSGGRIVLLSTPAAKEGFFYTVWTEGGDNWHRIQVPATQCPRISPDFLAEERRHMGDTRFRMEYLCQFGEAEMPFFNDTDITRAIHPDLTLYTHP